MTRPDGDAALAALVLARLTADATVASATGVVAALDGVAVEEAGSVLTELARRTGSSLPTVARHVVGLVDADPRPSGDDDQGHEDLVLAALLRRRWPALRAY